MARLGGVLAALGVVAMATGVLPIVDALRMAERAWPILLFVIAISVVAELAARAGVFDIAAWVLGRLARGSVIALWALVTLMAVVCTVVLSLDTTAVLLTPVVLALARAAGLPPVPFALTTVWLANTASLLLPISNLTNLLAAHRLGSVGVVEYLRLMGPSALVAIVVTVLVLWVIHRRSLRGRFTAPPRPMVQDPVLARVAACTLVVLIPLLVLMPVPWVPACGAAIVLTGCFAWRSRGVLGVDLLPWRLVVFAAGLFFAASAVETSGVLVPLGAFLGSGVAAIWSTAGVGLVGANLVNNLAAYVLLEPTTTSPGSLAALLVGVNVGPLITPWASLATLLWHRRLVAEGVDVSWRQYMRCGIVAAPLITAAAIVPIAVA